MYVCLYSYVVVHTYADGRKKRNYRSPIAVYALWITTAPNKLPHTPPPLPARPPPAPTDRRPHTTRSERNPGLVKNQLCTSCPSPTPAPFAPELSRNLLYPVHGSVGPDGVWLGRRQWQVWLSALIFPPCSACRARPLPSSQRPGPTPSSAQASPPATAPHCHVPQRPGGERRTVGASWEPSVHSTVRSVPSP